MLTCDMQIKDAKQVSLFWRKSGRSIAVWGRTVHSIAYGLKIDPETGAFSIVQLESQLRFGANTYHTHIRDQYINKKLCTDKIQLRLMVRKGRSEIYVNDRWIFNVGLKDILTRGDFSLIVDSGEVQIDNLKIHELEPLVLKR